MHRLLFVLLLPACSGGGFSLRAPLDDGFESLLVESTGCADLVLAAWEPGETIALHFNVEGLVAEAYAEGGTIERTFDLPDPDVATSVTQGRYLVEFTCDDLITHQPRVARTYEPVAGTATLTVTPTEEDPGTSFGMADATLVLEDVVWESGKNTVEVPSFTIEAVVGWFAG